MILVFSLMLFSLCLPYGLTQEQTTISLEAFIFTDGSVFLQGTSNIDPNLDVSYNTGKFSGLTNKLTSKSQEIWHFSLVTDSEFSQLNAKIVLPENSKLTGKVDSNSLPLIYTQGKSLVIEISDLQKPLSISFDYEVPLEPQKSDYTFYIYIAAIVIALIIAAFFIFRKKKEPVKIERKTKRAKKSEKKEQIQMGEQEKQEPIQKYKKKFETLKQTLNEREIKIIQGLIELKGKVKQNQLQKYTNISKAAFSRHINALEIKGLIEKKSLGRVNLIQMKLE